MNRPQRHEERRRPVEHRSPRNGEPQNNEEVTLDQYAGGVARRLIQESGVEDTTPHWRAIKKAYLAGYADAQR